MSNTGNNDGTPANMLERVLDNAFEAQDSRKRAQEAVEAARRVTLRRLAAWGIEQDRNGRYYSDKD